MKIYASILALTITGASAFVQPSAFSKSSNLKASYVNLDKEQTVARPNGVPTNGLGRSNDISNSRTTSISPVSDGSMSPISTQEMWKGLESIRVQGDTLRTCSFDERVERVEVLMKTNGRPLNADVELWQGHHNDPQRLRVYLEDGEARSFRATMESPGSSNSVAIRNIGTQEYPLTAGVEADFGGPDSTGSPADILGSLAEPRTVQGGAVYTLPYAPEVSSIQVMLNSDGRPMNAKVELLQGPNNVKASMEIYAEDGQKRPLYVIMESPGSGNVVRIVNTATVEYPLVAHVEPYIIDEAFIENNNGMTWR